MSTVPSADGAHPAPANPEPAATPELDPITLGRIMARSGLFPDITRASQAVVKILAGRELGIGPFAAMSDIHLVDGTPVVGARILAALVRQSDVYDYRVVEWTNERVSIDFYRHGQMLEPTVTFSEEDAERAGLTRPTHDGKPSNHTKFPRNMKFARAMSTGSACTARTSRPERRCTRRTSSASRTPTRDFAAPSGTTPARDDRDAGEERLDDGAPAAGSTDLTDAALEGAYSAATVVELCRFYYDQPRLAELSDDQAAEMAGRLRLARVQGVGDERLRRMAAKGLTMDDREHAFLLPPDVREWLPEGHFAWFVIEAVAQMDLAAFYGAYRQDGHGRAAFDPAVMVAVLLYAYARGVRSSRAIERACEEDVAFRVLAAHQVPDHTTIARFRQRHQEPPAELFGGDSGAVCGCRSRRRRGARGRRHQAPCQCVGARDAR